MSTQPEHVAGPPILGVSLAEIADMTAASALRGSALEQFILDLGDAATAPAAALRQLAEEDARLCSRCGERIFRWQTPRTVEFDKDVACCSLDCAERLEDDYLEGLRERVEEQSAEAARVDAGGWPS